MSFFDVTFFNCIRHKQISPLKSNWSANPFHQSALIENRGQFDGLDGIKNSAIEYAVQNDGVEIYFTQTGFTYKHNEYIVPKEEEHEAKNKSAKEEEDEKKVPCIPHYVHVQFENANTANMESGIESDSGITTYYTYGDLKDKSGKTSLKAFAYKKITFKKSLSRHRY